MLNPVRTMIRLLLVILLVAVLFSYAMFQGGFVSWFLFFSFAPLLIYSILMMIYPIHLSKIDRHLSKKYTQAGSTVEVTLSINRLIPFPIPYVIIEDVLPDGLSWNDTRHRKYQFLKNPDALKHRQKTKVVKFPLFKKKITYKYEITSIPRGKHSFSQVKFITGDFLGLVKKEHHFDVATQIFVEPREVAMRVKSERSAFEEGEQASYQITAKHTNVVSGVRDYAPGDKVSWVDWKTTARKQKLVTKEFEQEKHKDLTIVLNGLSQGEDDWLAFEASIEVAHALAKQSMHEHGHVSFVALGVDREEINLSQGQSQIDRLVRVLSELKLVQGESFGQRLMREGLFVSNDRNLVVVTHTLDQQTWKTLHQVNLQDVSVSIIFIKSKAHISTKENQLLDRLKHEGIQVSWLSEDQLTSKFIEVNA
ncbi:hypothetical protein CEY16_12720 [Halalkalibacillus sediminis]|uniref:DUF58 domain-containing protein n=1 Tax=Halalkalibacillus sediminis TaxID=2018042 RepID=A0A2I0QQR8_9BACI|nr:DUF58 domain-containing protein [Halalkalibacillus sediminis]PKR76676.1 hypothetical protein CEY16_12720 [Halalkalibacillus sediminis]